MSDRVSASIRIGGALSAEQAAMLVALISDEGRATEIEGEPFEPDDLRDGYPLEVCADQVPWGIFSTLETYLIANRIAFVRTSGSFSGSFGAERVVFRGGTVDTTESYAFDECGNVVIDESTARAFGSMGKIFAHFDKAQFSPGNVALADLHSASAQGVSSDTMSGLESRSQSCLAASVPLTLLAPNAPGKGRGSGEGCPFPS